MGKFNKLITCFMMYDKKVFHVTAAVERLRFFVDTVTEIRV